MRLSIPTRRASTPLRPAAWCALEGALRAGRQQAALRARRISPHAFLANALGGLLCQADVKPEFNACCHAYMNELTEPREAAALGDIREIFGESNCWRTSGEPLTQDSWANYDRIAPRYVQRLAQWQRGEITSVVDGPR
jgi:hypothetical protein